MIDKYTNTLGDRIHIMHTSGKTYDSIGKYLAEDWLDHNIKMNDDISVISVMNEPCLKDSPIRIQLEYNNIPLYNSAKDVKEWDNTLKFKYILECLSQVNTKYCLITDGRDAFITGNFDDEFMSKWHSFGKKIVYNATTAPYPKVVIEPHDEIRAIDSKAPYLNAGVCFGETKALIEFYTYCEKLNQEHPDNHSEQFIVRLARLDFKELVGVDYNSRLFRVGHDYDLKLTTYTDAVNGEVVCRVHYSEDD